MRRFVCLEWQHFVIIVLSIFFSTGLALGGDQFFVASLAGSNVVTPGPVATSDTGTCNLTLTGSDLLINCTHSVANPTPLSGIQFAPPGSEGPFRYNFSNPDSPISETWSGLTPDNVQELMDGNLYVQLRTAQYPSGYIRGQITMLKPEAEAVPTLNQWGFMIFGILLAGSAVLYIRKRKNTM